MEPLGRSTCAKPRRLPISNMKILKKRITRELRRVPPPPEARNFNKRSLLPTPGHAGTATWNRSPQEWLLPPYKLELTILLNKEGICPKGRRSPPEAKASSSESGHKRKQVRIRARLQARRNVSSIDAPLGAAPRNPLSLRRIPAIPNARSPGAPSLRVLVAKVGLHCATALGILPMSPRD